MRFSEWMRDEDVVLGSGGDAEVADVTCDSRAVAPGWAFVALQGEKTDGAAFVPSALQRGAAAILCDRGLDVPVPFARLGQGRRTMARLARKLYGNPDEALALIGVTGTNGKTTTTTLIRQLLRATGQGAWFSAKRISAPRSAGTTNPPATCWEPTIGRSPGCGSPKPNRSCKAARMRTSC